MSNLNRDVFIIETNRLILREFNENDLDELYTLTCQNDFIFKVSKKEYLKRYIRFLKEKHNQFKPDDTKFVLGIFLKDTKKLVGWTAVLPNKRLPSTQRERHGVISKDHTNKGYSTETGKAILEYLFKNSNYNEIVARVSLSNPYYIPLTKIMDKHGYDPMHSKNLSDNKKFNYFILTKERYMNKR